uniref:Tripartite motif-containing protein 16-like n=1 Tax=Sinocyclocheilus rhinocerous TaxID=307959 RepID=A0A673MWG2_9TELE
MAEASISWAEDQFSCPVCLGLLKEPVTIPCGHSYCKRCILGSWAEEDWKGIYRCPQCRQTFTPRPVLGKNVVFAEMVEKLKKTRLQAAPSPVPTLHHHTGSVDVKCDSSARTEKQVKYCSLLELMRDTTVRLIVMCVLLQRFAQTAVEDSERIFTEIIRSIEKRRSEVKQLIRDQERAAVSRAEARGEELEQEINDLKRRDTELKQFSEAQDHVHFLQSWPPVSFSESTDGFTVSSHLSFDNVVESVSRLRDKLLQFCTETIENLSGTVKTVQVIGAPEYQTREGFLQYSGLLTVDPNSVFYWLHLSEGNTVMTVTDTHQRYPDHPDRFDSWAEALCRESVSGRCYWEVEWSGDGTSGVDIAVTYKSIKRKGGGSECAAGRNDKSWNLYCTPTFCSFWHNNIETVLPVTHVSSRIGVFVDHSAGTLSFYSVSDTMSLIHRAQTTFTQPLYAVFLDSFTLH